MNGRVAPDEPDFRSLFEAIPGLYLVVTPDAPRYTIVAVSDGYCRATRTKREEILSRSLLEVSPDSTSDSLAEVIRTRTTDVGAIQRREERWFRPTNSPVLNAEGALTHIIHKVEDVTELVRREHAGAEHLRSANEELSSFLELAPDAIFLLDLEGRFTRVNEAACRMLGYSRDELLGKRADDVIPRLDAEKLARSRDRLLEGRTEVGEWTLVRKDGTTFPAVVSAKILPGGRWQAFVRDDTERKQLEEQLQVSNAELHRAQAVAKIGSWRLDIHRDELLWTEENYRIFGVQPGTPMGYDAFLACVHPDDRADVDRAWKAALGGSPYDIEHRLLVDGTVKWVREKADLAFDEQGRLLGGIGITQDITERRQLESALRLANDDLNRAQSVAKIGSWRLDIQRNELSWTDEQYQIFGVQRGRGMTYELFLERVHPDDREYVDREWNNGLRGAPYDIEHRLLVDGEVKWVREKADLEFDERGRVLGGVGITQDITERRLHEEEQRRVQQKIRESEERFDLAIRGAGLALWDWNVKTGEAIFSTRWAEMRGYNLGEVKPHVDSWSSGVHPEDWPFVQQRLEDHFSQRCDEYNSEHRVRTRDGHWIWLVALGKVFSRDEQGRPLRMVGIELDITERKRLEQDLRLAEAKSSGILALSADAIISVDPDGMIALFNEGAEKIFGYSRVEAVGQPLSMLLPERFRAIHQEHVRVFSAASSASRRMGDRSAVVVGMRKNGEEFPADAAISKLEIDGKRILTVALRDITEQKRVEREQHLLAELSAVFASTLDYEQTVTNVAQLAVRELADHCIVDLVGDDGTREHQVVSRDSRDTRLRDLLQIAHLDPARQHLTHGLLETRTPVLMERVTPESLASLSEDAQHLRALRDIDPRSVVGVPLLAHGELLGAMLFISTDPSRTYRPADLPLLEELARRAALAIDNARLYRAARDAVRIRDEVLGIVAHDLRNPLGTIILNAGLIGRSESEHCHQSATGIVRAATRMNRLIQDLLDVARIEARSLAIDPCETSARQVVEEAVGSQRARASAAHIRLEASIDDDLPAVWADRERVLQVLENLLGNAIKFTPRGGIIHVRAKRHEGAVLFSVADTGHGIAADALPRVFDRFWQARSGKRGGAGLGLAIVKGIVAEHGGRVWLESEVGRGSTFFFTIPRAPQRASLAPAHRASRPSAPA